MDRKFNILATTSRGYEGLARSELRFLFERIGDAAPTIERTGVSGLVSVRTDMDAVDAISRLRTLLHQTPYEFRFTLRIIPIEKVVCTGLGEIQQAVVELASKIGDNETFRVTVEKRFTAMHSKDIIEKVAANIKRRVNLTKPDKVVLIEILGGVTGVSVIEPQEILSIMKEKLL